MFGPSQKPCLTQDDLRQITFHKGNICNQDDVDEAIKVAAPTLVVGLAAYGDSGQGLLASAATNESAALQVNVVGFHHLLSTCLKRDIPRVIWASTLAVFGKPSLYEGGVVYDDSIRKPETFYGLTKVLAEDVAEFYRQQHGLSLTGLRLPLVFGTAKTLANIVQEIRPETQIQINSKKSLHHYPEVNGDKLRHETGFAPTFNLHEACRDYINEISRG